MNLLRVVVVLCSGVLTEWTVRMRYGFEAVHDFAYVCANDCSL